ncbi:MAG: DUF2190 family protein [Phycisphaerae bacterium]|nr:DUF2190 family protein [Phycisphaerae bacterium]
MAQTPVEFVATGAEVIPHTPGSAVTAGDVVVQGKLVGVAKLDIAANVKGSLAINGRMKFPKDSSNLSSVGAAVYWDADGSPVGGTALSGALTSTASGNTFAGWTLETAGTTVGTVEILLRSANDADTMGTDDLSDVGTVAHTAGRILVADGSKYEEVAVSGDVTLAANGAATLNAAHQEQIVIAHVEDLGAGVDIAARPIFVHPRACTLTSVGILTEGAPAGIDDDNTCVVTIKDLAGNTIVTKTYNTETQPPTSDYEDLGALSGTYSILTAGEAVTATVTQGANSNMPAFSLILRSIPTNA